MNQPLTSGRLIRRLAFAATIALSAASLVNAAPPAPVAAGPSQNAQGADRRRLAQQLFEGYRQLLGTLNLDSEQQTKVRDIMLKTRDSMKSFQQDAQTMSPQDRKSGFEDAISTLNSQISNVLNDDQKTTFESKTDELLQNAENSMRQGGRPGGNADGQRGQFRAVGPDANGGATTQPTSRPTGPRGPGGGFGGGAGGGPGGPGGGMMNRINAALDAAAATDDQRAQLKPIIDDLRDQIVKIFQDSAGDRQGIRDKVQAARQDAIDKAKGILSADQIEKFRAAMMARPNGPGGGAGGPGGGRGPGGRGDGNPPTTAPSDGNGPPPMDPPPPGDKPGDKPGAMVPHDSSIATAHGAGNAGLAASMASNTNTPTTKPAVIAVGDPMPVFNLKTLNGRLVSNKTYATRPTVIIFGSLTAPTFRDHAAVLQQLANRYSSRANFLIVYTREMHPMGPDETVRNRDDHVAVAAPNSIANRISAAKQARDQLQLSIDVAADSIDDTLTTELDGFPNAAAVFDSTGKLATHLAWAEPFAIERAIDQALKHK